MNKSILGLAVSAIFMVATVHAEDIDTSATVSIAGIVTGTPDTSASCTVNVSKALVNLTTDVTNLRDQGVKTTPDEGVSLSVSGDKGCQDLLLDSRIAYKFVGTADEATGKVLANTDTSEGAAQGVGVGVYDQEGNVVNVNTDYFRANLYNTIVGLGLVKLAGQTPSQGTVKSALTIEILRL